MELVAALALCLYVPFVFATALLLRRRAPSRSAWIAVLPALNILALADLTGITHSHRFDAVTDQDIRSELNRNAARNSALKPPL